MVSPLPRPRYRLSFLSILTGLLFPISARAVEPTMTEALDGAGLTWFNNSDEKWIPKVDAVKSHDGTDHAAISLPAEKKSTLETRIQGPGVLRWWWKVESMETGAKLEMEVDDFRRQKVSQTQDWTEAVLVLPAGPHVIQWKAEGEISVLLDSVTFGPPPAPVSLSEAVDAPGLTFTTGSEPVGLPAWYGSSDAFDSRNDTDGARTGTLANGQAGVTWLETTVTGPGLLSFHWKNQSDAESFFSMDGSVLRSHTDDQGWYTVHCSVPAGAHAFRWSFRGAGIQPGIARTRLWENALWVDAVSYTPGAPGPLAAAGAPEVEALTESPAGWNATVAGARGTVLATGPLPSGTSAHLRLQQPSAGVLRMKLDNSEFITASFPVFDATAYSGSSIDLPDGWKEAGHYIADRQPAFTMNKKASTADAGFLMDDITFEPFAAVNLTEALDLPGAVWTTGGNGTWKGVATPQTHAAGGGDLAAYYINGFEPYPWLETTVTGTGVLSYYGSEPGPGLILDGVIVTPVKDGPNRYQYRLLEAGPHVVRWTFPATFASPLRVLDGVSFAPEPLVEVPLAVAVDNPNLPWTTGGDVPWKGLQIPSANGIGPFAGGHAARAGRLLQQGQTSWIETQVTGPGFLTGSFPETALLTIDGEASYGWSPGLIRVPSGLRKVRWTWSDSIISPPWMDNVAWHPFTAPTSADLDAALETPGAGWQASDGDWIVEQQPDGRDVVKIAPWPGQNFSDPWSRFPWAAWLRVPESLRTGFLRFSVRTYRPAEFFLQDNVEIVLLGNSGYIAVTPEWQRIGLYLPGAGAGDLTFNFQGFADPVPALLELDRFHLFSGEPGDHYVWWAAENGLSGELTPDFAPQGDSDHDGVANLLEYAFNGRTDYGNEPLVSPPGMPQVSIVTIGQERFLRLSYWQRRTAVGTTYMPEFSTGAAGAAWSPGQPLAEEQIDDTWKRVTVLDTVPVSAANPRRFGRVRVTYAEPE